MSPWVCSMLAVVLAGAADEEVPYGRGTTEANKERLVLDDMEDVSDWYNGSPEETTISRSDQHVREGTYSLKFANRVDHTKGEQNYPVGWPRTGRDLSKQSATDWSAYDLFECWVYVETSRESLPGNPLGVGFYHSGARRSSSVPLNEIQKDRWTKIVIPVAQIDEPHDVQRVQFNISEANYRHGDRVDFSIDDVVLTRFVEPAIAEFDVQRRIVYSTDSMIVASFELAGYKGMDEASVEFEIGGNNQPARRASVRAARQGEVVVAAGAALAPGNCPARLSLRDREGKLIDRKQTEFRVIRGPF